MDLTSLFNSFELMKPFNAVTDWKREQRLENGDRGSQKEEDEALQKPQPPAEETFDEDQVRRDVLTVMLQSLPPPGETPIQLHLERVPVSCNNER